MLYNNEDEIEIVALESEIDTLYSLLDTSNEFIQGLEEMGDIEVSTHLSPSEQYLLEQQLQTIDVYFGNEAYESYIVNGIKNHVNKAVTTTRKTVKVVKDTVKAVEDGIERKRRSIHEAIVKTHKLLNKIHVLSSKTISQVLRVASVRKLRLNRLKEAIEKLDEVDGNKNMLQQLFGKDVLSTFANKFLYIALITKSKSFSFSDVFEKTEYLNKHAFTYKDYEDYINMISKLGTLIRNGKVSDHEINKVIDDLTKKSGIDLSLIANHVSPKDKAFINDLNHKMMITTRITKNKISGFIIVSTGLTKVPHYRTFKLNLKGMDVKAFDSKFPKKKAVIDSLVLARKMNNSSKGISQIIEKLNQELMKDYDEFSEEVYHYTREKKKRMGNSIGMLKDLYLSGPRIGLDIVMNIYDNVDIVMEASAVYLKVGNKEQKGLL